MSLYCPSCGSKLVKVDNGCRACLNMRCAIYSFLINDKVCAAYHKKVTVLQKKLDNAMDALNELKDGHVQGSAGGIKLWVHVIAEAAIKEIEDIKE